MATVAAVDPDPRPHLNLVFIGHVDAGKSTTCGNIMYLSGLVDERTIEKYQKEAKQKNRDSWFLAYLMDTGEEERQKGITIEVGRTAFETANRRYTILDAPGHKNYVVNMIAGATQADVGVLIISARKGEFETGFERGGQTREHAMLAKTLGISRLVVAVNKMDDPTVEWRQERFTEICEKLKPFLRSCGYRTTSEDDVIFIPISGLGGDNLKEPSSDPRAAWVAASNLDTLFHTLDSTKLPPRKADAPLRIPLLESFKEMGVMVTGKIEQGQVRVGTQCIIQPANLETEVQAIYIEDVEVNYALPGENVRLKLKNVEEDQIHRGFVMSAAVAPCPIVAEFEADVLIVELLDHRPLITAGYSCVFHCHTVMEEVVVTRLIESTELATKKKVLKPRFVKSGAFVKFRLQLQNSACLEAYGTTPQMGRFTLRDEGKTVAIGKITAIIPNGKTYGGRDQSSA